MKKTMKRLLSLFLCLVLLLSVPVTGAAEAAEPPSVTLVQDAGVRLLGFFQSLLLTFFIRLNPLLGPVYQWFLGALPAPETAAQNDIDEILAAFHDPNGRMLSCAHRGDWRNYPENSLAAIQSCIDMGADMVELDIKQTKDGVLILSHDDTVTRMTNGFGTISEMTWDEISRLYLREGMGAVLPLTTHRVATLEDALRLCRGKIMLNLDKAYAYKEDVYELLVKHDCLDIAMFKGGESAQEVGAWFAELTAAGKAPPLFSCKLSTDDFDFANRYIDDYLNTGSSPFLEMKFKNWNEAAADADLLARAKTGMRLFIPMMSASKCGGNSDDPTGWAAMHRLGYNSFQTDRIADLVYYLDDVNAVRDATAPIEAAHFLDYAGIDLLHEPCGLNKVVTGISDGDFLLYNDLDFGDGVTALRLAAVIAGTGTLSLHADSPDAPPVAVLPLRAGTTVLDLTAAANALTGTHDLYTDANALTGTHDLYLRFTGKTLLMQLDSLQFTRPQEYE